MLLAQPLKHRQVARMFPVLMQVLPTVTLKDWTAFATEMIRRRKTDGDAGVVVIETDNDTIRGGFIYEIAGGPQQPRRLFVRHVMIPALGQSMVADAMHRAVEEIARTQSCDFVDVELPADAKWEACYFAGRGHAVHDIVIAPVLPVTLR